MNRKRSTWEPGDHSRGVFVPWIVRVLPALMAAMMTAVPGMAGETASPEAAQNHAGEEIVAAADSDGEPMPRDPFWPVGYTPPDPEDPVAEEAPAPEPEVPEVEPDWQTAVQRLRFQGRFSARGRVVASVNNRIVEIGSLIGVRLPPYIYVWRVTAIHSGGIETERVRTEFIE